MDSSNYESEKLAQSEETPKFREELPSSGHFSSSQTRELTELKQILRGNLTPNKRAIIETLIYSWEARRASKSKRGARSPISIEKKKSKVNKVSGSYPGWNVASLQLDA